MISANEKKINVVELALCRHTGRAKVTGKLTLKMSEMSEQMSVRLAVRYRGRNERDIEIHRLKFNKNKGL